MLRFDHDWHILWLYSYNKLHIQIYICIKVVYSHVVHDGGRSIEIVPWEHLWIGRVVSHGKTSRLLFYPQTNNEQKCTEINIFCTNNYS